jgi:phosphate transport system substrate-binding protein
MSSFFILFLVLQDSPGVDPDLPAFRPAPALKGNLSSLGSDTLNNMMTFWAESLNKHHPELQIQIEGKGAGLPSSALTSGFVQLAPMSRPMKPKEEQAFQEKYGYPPTRVAVAIDALAIFVNSENPLEEITLEQIDGVFSKTLRRKGKNVSTWGDLGLTEQWAQKPLALYGRNSASGIYGFFKERALLMGEFKDEVKEQPGSAAVAQSVALDRHAIGYVGLGYAVAKIKALRIASKTGEKGVAPTPATARDGTYPLARSLFIYVNRPPGGMLEPNTLEFLKLILSKEGQASVVQDGYIPLSAPQAAEERKRIE